MPSATISGSYTATSTPPSTVTAGVSGSYQATAAATIQTASTSGSYAATGPKQSATVSGSYTAVAAGLSGLFRWRGGVLRPMGLYRRTAGVNRWIGGPQDPKAMPVGNLPGWNQIFTEDFDTPFPVGAFPVVPSGGLDGYIQTTAPSYGRYGSKIKFSHDGQVDTYGGAQYYPSKTVSTRTDVANANGVLDAYLHTETIGGVSTALGLWMRALRPDGASTQIYGRVAIRMRADSLPGWGAAHLFIASVWPAGGEQDWFEGDLADVIKGFFHNANADGSQVPVTLSPAQYWQDWHTCIIEWTPGRARWYIDNSLALDRTTQVGSTAAKYIPIQIGGSKADGTPPSPSVSGHFQIDWLAMWDPA